MARRRRTAAPKWNWSTSTSSSGRTRGRASTSVRLPGTALTWTVSQRAGKLPRVTLSTRTSTRG